MLKTLVVIASLAGVLSFSPLARAQAMPTAVAKGALQVGGAVTYAKPDYGEKSIEGISGYADFDFKNYLGVEAMVHYIALDTPTDIAENSYLIGPRFIYTRGRFSPYAKALVGIADLDIQEQQDNVGHQAGYYFAYALGAGLDIRLSKHWNLRPIDFEFQHWNYETGLTPAVISVGFAYHIR
jgi:opacity protein-like surface antigen